MCPTGIVDLSNASVDTYEDYASGWPKKNIFHREKCKQGEKTIDDCSIKLNGFTYQHLTNPHGIERTDNYDVTTPVWEARLPWLDAQPTSDLVDFFKPQPWQQLANTLLHEGYEEDAKRISIERRISYRYSKGPRWTERSVSTLLHWFADYGYNPWKTIIWSIGFILIFGGLFYIAGIDCAEPGCRDAKVFVPVLAGDVFAVDTADQPTDKLAKIYPALGAWHYSLDLFFPIFDLGMESYWHANTDYELPVNLGGEREWMVPIGLILDWLAVVERILGALMVALAITGFTGLLTRGD